jgi:hypothetical protein
MIVLFKSFLGLSGQRHLVRPSNNFGGYRTFQLLLPSTSSSPSSQNLNLNQHHTERQYGTCQRNHFSSSSTAPQPKLSASSTSHGLFLWVGPKQEADEEEDTVEADWNSTNNNYNKLLLPIDRARSATIFTPQDVLDAVTVHYTSQGHFVGGMGEDDPGVWFATPARSKDDTVDHISSIIQEGIALVKEERHGVKFGLYTTGLGTVPSNINHWKDMRLSSLQVSLFAANPNEYHKVTGRPSKDFGTLCGFIVQAVEEGMAVEVGVLEEYKGSARDLALSLGARHVHVFKG